MGTGRALLATTAVVLIASLPIVAGHDDDGMDMNMDVSSPVDASNTTEFDDAPMNYFRYAHHGGWIYAHVALMILAWVFAMPISLMLSVARSRFHLPAQLVFHLLNGVGVFTSFVYNHSTPDLYKHNSHHPVGWIVTSLTIAWTLMSLFVAYSEYKSKREASGGRSMASHTMFRRNLFKRYRDQTSSRSSRDSGHGTERNSASLMSSRQNSQDSFHREEPESPMHNVAFDNNDDDDDQSEKRGLLGDNRVDRFISRHVQRFSTPRASKILRGVQIVLEKFLLILGFTAGTTGFVVWGGIFRDRAIFSGLAHFIKGGIFFFYGLLTLGRWMGAFGEFGWAWNVRPRHPLVSRWKTRVPSAEFVESFVIWTYGASNVFLEHLNSWGQAWSPQDFEHVSITILFFGGGLLGMMIESSWARELMNTSVFVQKSAEGEVAGPSRFHASGAAEAPDEVQQLWEEPKTYKTSLNPLPGLVIMLLGIMMSAHHQESMVSTMMHSQWGTLFVGFAMARAATYIILYIKPPTSHFPARPPSELVAAFCLTAGGLMFMFSARGVVQAIEGNGLMAMTIFTLTTGLAAAILAWEVLVFALKGWAIRKEHAAAGRPLM